MFFIGLILLTLLAVSATAVIMRSRHQQRMDRMRFREIHEIHLEDVIFAERNEAETAIVFAGAARIDIGRTFLPPSMVVVSEGE